MVLLFIVVAAAAPIVPFEIKNYADAVRAIKEHYTKHEYMVPMRDGVRLYTSVYTPKDRSRPYAMILNRTPYGNEPYGVDNDPPETSNARMRNFAPAPSLAQRGFIFVHQDVRGRFMSEGTFVDVRPISAKGPDEATDAYDSIDWLVKNIPNNNGRVGTWGVSYPGFYAALAAVNPHPALKAVSPQAPVTDWFVGDDFHHNGAFLLADSFGFMGNFGRARPVPVSKGKWDFEPETGDIYDFFLKLGPLSNANTVHLKNESGFWNDCMQHGTYDAFWQARNPRPFYKGGKVAVLTVGGWYDAEDLWGALETYRAFEKQKGDNAIVMGPWRHGGWVRGDGESLGDINFDSKTSYYYRDQNIAPFFLKHLYGEASPSHEAYIFETGTNEWRTYETWPPQNSKALTFYFGDEHSLTETAPTQARAMDAYVSDPNKPVPYTWRTTAQREIEYMVDDQRFASRRPDVLVYETPKLQRELTTAGPLTADLWVSTSGTDSDFVVKVIDVWPDDAITPEPNPGRVRHAGMQQLVRAEVMRGKFRNSLEKPEPFVPGEVTRVRFTLPDMSHTFRSGHKLMVQVQSSWFPLIDRNPQTFVDIYAAKPSDFITATQQIFRQKNAASSLTLTVLK
jgi:putative CocE/NonD family hydrolase